MTDLDKLSIRLDAIEAAIASTSAAAAAERKMSTSNCKASGHVTQALTELNAAKTHVLHLLERVKTRPNQSSPRPITQ